MEEQPSDYKFIEVEEHALGPEWVGWLILGIVTAIMLAIIALAVVVA